MIRKNLVIAIFCVLSFQILFAQMPGEISYKDESILPGGKKGERIRSLIATVNSNDPTQIRRFVEEAFTEKFQKLAPMEQHINVVQGIHQQTGGVDFHSIRTYVPEHKGETVVILKDRNFDSWRAFVIRFDGSENFLIAGLQFNVVRTPSNVKEPTLSEKQFIQTIKNLLLRLGERDVFSGTFLIARGDEVLLEYACGEASKRFHVPNNIDTKLNIGSMNKMFTATAIAQLVEKGLLSFEDTLNTFVDESWLPKEITSKVTLHHLLTHTSGLGSYFNETYMNSSRALFRKLDDYKPLVRDEKLAFEPGERFRYSNTGMFLLGAVIESVTSQSYFEYIRENIYKPAGMKNTDCYEMDRPVENLAIGYSSDLKSKYGWQNNLYLHVIKGGPAGGGFSTVGDLYRFAQAIQKGKLVSVDSLKIIWKDHKGDNYGYGFSLEEGPNGKVVGHSGGFSGINANLDIFLDKGYIVAVLSNYDRGASSIAEKVRQLLTRVK